jgi:hypothetical protein
VLSYIASKKPGRLGIPRSDKDTAFSAALGLRLCLFA